MSSQTTATGTIRGHVDRRSSLLADRIEEGAALLAAFAEGLSEVEWHTPISATDRRTVGVIVHHVAGMYPIEIDLARAVAGGKSVSDVTWEAVAQLNAKHAHDNAGVSKAAALELLRQNSREAAAVVRDFTDEELGRMFREARQSQHFAKQEAVSTLEAFCSFLDSVGLGLLANAIKITAWAWDRVKQIWQSIFG